MSYYKYRDIEDYIPFIAIAIVLIIAPIIIFICIPKKGYMQVDSTHWKWTIDLFEYRQVHESGSVSNHYTRGGAEDAARSRIPDDAYNIDIKTHSYTKTHHHEDQDGHKYTTTEIRYTADYSYTVDRWIKYTELNSYGNDKFPYEPECDLPTDVECPKIGDLKRQNGHSEEYSATGSVNGENQTVLIPKWAWEKLTENDEFSYKKSVFDRQVQDIKIAE